MNLSWSALHNSVYSLFLPSKYKAFIYFSWLVCESNTVPNFTQLSPIKGIRPLMKKPTSPIKELDLPQAKDKPPFIQFRVEEEQNQLPETGYGIEKLGDFYSWFIRGVVL